MVSKVKDDKPTYHLENIHIQNGTFNKDQSDAVSAVANALKANAEALARLADACRGPASSTLETGIRIG
jgi:hypothetical protein